MYRYIWFYLKMSHIFKFDVVYYVSSSLYIYLKILTVIFYLIRVLVTSDIVRIGDCLFVDDTFLLVPQQIDYSFSLRDTQTSHCHAF